MVSRILLLAVLAVTSYFVVVTVHELGHIVAGLLNGFKFWLFVLGPLGLKRNEQERIVFYIEKNPAMWGGVGGTLPSGPDERNFRRFARIIIAGPVFSLVFGIVCLILFTQVSNIFLLLMGAMSTGIAIATLIPARMGCFYSDGGRWLRIVRKGRARLVETAVFEFIQSYTVHKNYSKIDVDKTRLLTEDKDDRNKYLGHYFAWSYYADNGDVEAASQHEKCMESLADRVPKNYIKLLRS